MSDDVVLFNVGDRLVDGWGNDHGEVPKDQPDHRAAISEVTTTSNLDGNLNTSGQEEKVDLDEMSGKQLRAELTRRNNGRTDEEKINATGVKTVGDLRSLLKADDESQTSQGQQE